MPITGADVADAGLLAVAAYNPNPAPSISVSGWTILGYNQLATYSHGLLSSSSFTNGVFSNSSFLGGDGQAFVAINHDTGKLAISFRGSQQIVDWIFTDLQSPYASFQSHYQLFRTLINAALDYAADGTNGVSTILVTGHSLGGAIVENMLADYRASNIVGVSFGSPGDWLIPNNASSDTRLVNMFNSGDPVHDAASAHNQGIDISVDRPFSADYSILGLLGSGAAQEHASLLYQQNALALGNSELWSTYWADRANYAIRIGTDGNNGNISGTSGKDFLLGDSGIDSISGGAGDDLIDSGAGDDELFGGGNNDHISGG
jgi:Ca2+-binding RTX toxin-like protein